MYESLSQSKSLFHAGRVPLNVTEGHIGQLDHIQCVDNPVIHLGLWNPAKACHVLEVIEGVHAFVEGGMFREVSYYLSSRN